MTTDGEALFHAICEQPWEDTPRLMYADWLEENGDPQRAEFIRLQIEAARPGMNLAAPDLAARAEHLRKESEGRWTRGSPTTFGVRIERNLRRGFYNEVTFDGVQAFHVHADEAFGWTPIDTMSMRHVTDDSIAEVLDSRYVARLMKLSLSSGMSDRGCEVISECPQLVRLESLEFWSSTVTDAGALMLANSPHLKSLTNLRLGQRHGVVRLQKPTVALMKRRFRYFSR